MDVEINRGERGKSQTPSWKIVLLWIISDSRFFRVGDNVVVVVVVDILF